MSANQSNLSGPEYRDKHYDFVVATTQASINSGLLEYLHKIDQEAITMYFAEQQNGEEKVYVGKEWFEHCDIDPFEIPDGTDYDDERITRISNKQFGFDAAIKIKLGLPNMDPKKLPPIIELGSSAETVVFNMLCSEIKMIENALGTVRTPGSWNVWSQPSKKPWYFSTKVDLIYADLDKELNTEYFKNNEDKRKALLAQLENLDSGAFSLQQLLFDLDNAALQSIPNIPGLPDTSKAKELLSRYFVNAYHKVMKVKGAPVLAVHTVYNTPDTSTLKLQSMERQVSPLIDANGETVQEPTKDQKQVTTLDYLCSTTKNRPASTTFKWNWVEPKDIGNESGIIAINRNTFATYIRKIIEDDVNKCCPGVYVNVHRKGLNDYDIHEDLLFEDTYKPTCDMPDEGSEVLKFTYTAQDRSEDEGRDLVMVTDKVDLTVTSDFRCSVFFEGETIRIENQITLNLHVETVMESASVKFVDKKVINEHTMSVDSNGKISLSKGKTSTEDHAEKYDENWLLKLLSDVEDIINRLTSQAENSLQLHVPDISISDLQNFVFPGANVFTYKDVKFSEHQDLITSITYLTPSETKHLSALTST